MAKTKKESSSSSSSSDEDDERLRQLKDSVVTLESLKPVVSANKNASGTAELKSKREPQVAIDQNLDNDSDDLNNFKLTPEFQRFVAKKLQKKLDEFGKNF